MSCQTIFEVKTLDINESWDLFKYTLQSTELPADIEEIAKSVTRRCDGLPLGIITVAGSMRGARDICEWRNTLEQLKACSEGHDKMGSDVFPILEWSYSRLNDCQRHCFLYCCLYPEDACIPREELINIFICAELMDRRSTRNLEIDQGHAILNQLIRVCLLEETTNWERNKCVKMHDLIRDMALRITSGKNSLETNKDAPRFLVSIVEAEKFSKIKSEQKEEWREDLSAVSINLFGTHRLDIPMDMSPNCPNLSTLLFKHHCYSKSPPFDKIPSSFFNQMRGLKVLKLENPFIKQLPDIISDMVNLAALLLSGCSDLASVPPLGKLSQLRILDLSRTKIDDFPEGLERLFNLEVICLDQMLKMKRISKGTLSKLRSLQQLRLHIDVVVDDLEVLNQLEVFYGCLSSVDVYNQHTNFERLKHYQIKVGERNYFSNPKTENGLVFSCCNFHGGSNVGRVRLLPQDIKELTLHSCIGMDKCIDVFPTLSSSKQLSYLTIVESAEVEFLLKLSSSPPDEPVMSPCGPFQKLRVLRLLDLPNFIELFNWDSKALHRHLPPGTFSSLINLEIRGCKKMRKLFTVQLLQNLQNLEVLYVSHCEELEEIAADDIEVGSGGGCIQSTSAGATNTHILPKLRLLYLFRLPKLKYICEGTIICNSIRSIWVADCPEVKRLPLFPPNTGLEIHGTKKWWESLEWDDPNSKNALDPFFRDWDIVK